ncbi:NAD-P-binding protein [Abortiporus biennis]|nr:NAD-P-binding protein [Abortiporus biennis]
MGSFFSKGFNPDTDVGDLNGKVIIVTGGNTGIGYATIQHLARHGAKVYMAARSEEKAKAAIEKLNKEGLGPRNGEVIWLELDLSDPRKVKKSAEAFLEKEKRLDCLINNAAMLVAPYAKTVDDIQDIMMINHIGHFVLTMTLLPLLKETAKEPGSDVRVVTVSSNAINMLSKGVRFRNRDDFNNELAKSVFPGMARYALSKLANALFAKELQKKLDEEKVPILCLSLHPGAVKTERSVEFASNLSMFLRTLLKAAQSLFFIPTEQGSYASVFAAVAPTVRAEPEKYKGAYLTPPGVISKPSKDAENPELAKELWDTTESLLKEIGVEVQSV